MPVVSCPKCRAPIGEADINMKEGVALCRACDKLWRLGELASDPEEAQVDQAASTEMPGGCWLRDSGTEVVIGASCRSPQAFFFLFFAAFWNSIVSIFVSFAIAGLYTNLIGPLPRWFPAPGPGKSGSGNLGPNMPLSMTLFLCVFLIPFVLIGLGTASAALTGLIGKIEITLRRRDGVAFTGIGPIGWKRRFEADLVRSVRIGDAGSSTNNRPDKTIFIESNRQVKIGTMLTDQRRRWLAGALRKLLVPVPKN